MKNLELTQKVLEGSAAVKWKLETGDNGRTMAWLGVKRLSNTDYICIGKLLKETKRGWTIEVYWLTSKTLEVFLPREDFYIKEV